MLPADVPLLAEIFRAAIEELTAEDYSESQQEAWAEAADDLEKFGARLAGELTLVATHSGSAVGFASLADNTRIDMLYVHPAAAGQGAGAMLADALATAAFVLGPEESVPLLTRVGVEGVIVTADLEIIRTAGISHA